MAENIVISIPLACEASSKINTARYDKKLTNMSTHDNESHTFLSASLKYSNDRTGTTL